jgi:hypothetical protein
MWMIEAPKKPRKPTDLSPVWKNKNSLGCKEFATKEK